MRSTVTYSGSTDRYHVIEIDGDETYWNVEDGTELVEFYSIDVREAYAAFLSSDRDAGPHTFTAHLETLVTDPMTVPEYTGCDDCGDVVVEDEQTYAGGNNVCEDCLDNYSMCEDCEEYVHGDNIESVGWDHYVCRGCYENNYSYCEDCDVSYHDDDSYEHEHDHQCDCEAPRQNFRVPNQGSDPLSNDTRLEVDLAAGHISDEGMHAVVRLLQKHSYTMLEEFQSITYSELQENAALNARYEEAVQNRQNWMHLAYRLEEIGDQWQTKQGNFTKRLSRFAHKTYGLKVPPAILTEVGNIGSQHSQGVSVSLEVTRNLNLPAEEFAHEDSCWWQSYGESRCALKNNGGFGLRTFTSRTIKPWGGNETHTVDEVSGRAWVMPLRDDDGSLVPTFDTETADAFVVFNGYGDLSGYAPARTMAHLTGMTYRKISLYASPMYINSEAGYLVAPQEIVDRFAETPSLLLDTDTHSSLAYREERRDAVLATV